MVSSVSTVHETTGCQLRDRKVEKKNAGNCHLGKMAEACNKLETKEVSASWENDNVVT